MNAMSDRGYARLVTAIARNINDPNNQEIGEEVAALLYAVADCNGGIKIVGRAIKDAQALVKIPALFWDSTVR